MILIDSNFFINLLDERDRNHKQAKKILEKISNKEKIVTDGVILETITLAGSLFGGKIATELYHNIVDNYKVHQTFHLFNKAMITHLKYDGTLSLVDTLLIETMKELNIYEIVSFDSDFDNKKGIIRVY
ncbi:MAG: PIN domain-containing protein [Methanobrevibacter sp.]|nr:PIN domain-containing protein [Methanobrevibacter sp.]